MPSTTWLSISTAKSDARSASSYWLRTFGIDEQAQVRVVDLDDRDAFVAKQLDFAADDRHAVADEVFALGIGLRRLHRVPHSLAEQRGRGNGGFDSLVGQRFQEFDFLGDEAGLLRRELIDDDGPGAAVGGVAC